MSENKKLIGSFFREPDGAIKSELDKDLTVSDVKSMIENLEIVRDLSLNRIVHDTKGLNWIRHELFHYPLVGNKVKEVDK